jgi:hypothetical protein
MRHCLGRLGALPKKLVWDREGAIHRGGRRDAGELRRQQAAVDHWFYPYIPWFCGLVFVALAPPLSAFRYPGWVGG